MEARLLSDGMAEVSCLRVFSKLVPPTVWLKVSCRKAHRCQACKGPIFKGESAYKPTTNKWFRYARIGECCIATPKAAD